MIVEVKMFAAARQAVNAESVQLTLTCPIRVHELREQLAEQYPNLKPLLERSLIAVDEQYAGDDTMIAAGADVAVIPPVSGG